MYKQVFNPFKKQVDSVLIERSDGSASFIPFDPANTDYQEYLRWLELGNTPKPADNQPNQ